jgi:hypothetical protein
MPGWDEYSRYCSVYHLPNERSPNIEFLPSRLTLSVQAGLASVEGIARIYSLRLRRAVELSVTLFLIPLLHGRELEMVVGMGWSPCRLSNMDLDMVIGGRAPLQS